MQWLPSRPSSRIWVWATILGTHVSQYLTSGSHVASSALQATPKFLHCKSSHVLAGAIAPTLLVVRKSSAFIQLKNFSWIYLSLTYCILDTHAWFMVDCLPYFRNLSSYSLAGTIPPEISQLPNLTSLYVASPHLWTFQFPNLEETMERCLNFSQVTESVEILCMIREGTNYSHRG